MKQQPSSQVWSPMPRAALVWHRMWQRLHGPGVLGLGLIGLSLLVGASAWQARSAALSSERKADQTRAAIAPGNETPNKTAAADQILPARSSAHALMAQIQEAAAAQQLTWEAADYRLKEATADSFARLEVHGNLKGAYRPLRLWLNQLHASLPSLVVWEARFSRPHPDTADVEAKLVLVIPLADVGDAVPQMIKPEAKP